MNGSDTGQALQRWWRSDAAATSTVTTLERIRDASTNGEGESLAKTSDCRHSRRAAHGLMV